MTRYGLSINPGTASNRLVRDLLFAFVKKAGCPCYRCGGELTRETFTIDHKKPWRRDPNADELFFDLNNIAFSHAVCNNAAARKVLPRSVHGTRSRYDTGCRCRKCRAAQREYMAKYRLINRRSKLKSKAMTQHADVLPRDHAESTSISEARYE